MSQNRVYSQNEISTLLDALTSGEINDVGISSSVGAKNMSQKDIDFLVALIQELQEYHQIGTIEECKAYKNKALNQ